MKRHLYPQLQAWKNAKNRKPLILRGARQVGKTYLLKEFGKNEYEEVIYLNFEKNKKLAEFFSDALDPKTILTHISAHLNQTIHHENTLLIFDEIQESPAALNSLKYFQEEANEYHIVAAGSLLGVKLANEKGFPVGKVNFLDLYPLCFLEFLNAVGKNKLYEFLLALTEFKEIPSPLHDELLSLLKKYLFIGGMPEVVADYVENNNLLSLRQIHMEILDAYALDFAKHAPKEELARITQVWESIPNQLAKENKKFIFSAIKESARGREYETAIQWLADAGLIYKVYHLSVPKLPLAGFANKNAFKVFLLDVGLLAAQSNVPADLVIDDEKLFSEFSGAFTENYVASELAPHCRELFYWASEGSAEIDFVIEDKLQAYPLEVKAGTSRKKKSLLVYADKFKPRCLLRASLMNLRKDGDVCNYPLYLIGRLKDFL